MELVLRYAKDALDASRVADGDLNVGLLPKSRTGIRRLTLRENSLDGINRGELFVFREWCVIAE